MTDLLTGEAVGVDLRLARVGTRLLAALIDFAVQVTFVVAGVLAVNALAPVTALGLALVVVVVVVAFVGYPAVAESLTGRTLGKWALGLRVVRDDGGPIRFRHALVRAVIGAFVEKPGLTIGLAALLSAGVSTRAQRLGDLAAGTVVLRERSPAPVPLTVQMPRQLAGWAATLEASGLSESLALQVRTFLSRAAQLRPEAREQLGRDLADRVAAAVHPPPPPGTAWPEFLLAVLAHRRARAAAPPVPGWPAGSVGAGGGPDSPAAGERDSPAAGGRVRSPNPPPVDEPRPPLERPSTQPADHPFAPPG